MRRKNFQSYSDLRAFFFTKFGGLSRYTQYIDRGRNELRSRTYTVLFHFYTNIDLSETTEFISPKICDRKYKTEPRQSRLLNSTINRIERRLILQLISSRRDRSSFARKIFTNLAPFRCWFMADFCATIVKIVAAIIQISLMKVFGQTSKCIGVGVWVYHRTPYTRSKITVIYSSLSHRGAYHHLRLWVV